MWFSFKRRRIRTNSKCVNVTTTGELNVQERQYKNLEDVARVSRNYAELQPRYADIHNNNRRIPRLCQHESGGVTVVSSDDCDGVIVAT